MYNCGFFCNFLQCDNEMLFVVQLISSTDRHKPCMEHPIKFISRRRPNTLKFKINPGTWALQNEPWFSCKVFCSVILSGGATMLHGCGKGGSVCSYKVCVSWKKC